MNSPTDKNCDPVAIAEASVQTLADVLIALCSEIAAQDRTRRALVTRLREGAEHARALEAQIRRAGKQRA